MAVAGFLKRVLTNVLLILISTVLTLGAAEVLLRLASVQSAKSAASDRGFFSRFDPKLGWAPIPSVSRVHTEHGFSVHVKQNSLGLRAAESVGPQRDSNAHRVLVLGDSYVWGYGAEQDDIFTSARVIGGHDPELVNFGVSGYGTGQELLWYERLGRRFDVDEVVLVFTTYNDVGNTLASKQYGYYKPYFTLDNGALVLHDDHIRDVSSRRWWQTLRTKSRVISLMEAGWLNFNNMRLNKFVEPKGVADARDRVISPGNVSDRDRRGLDLVEAILRRLRDDVSAHGAKFSVIFVPYKPHILTGQPFDHPLAPMLAARLQQDGIPCYEPYPLFLQAAKQGQSLFHDRDNHFNAAGHALFARLFTDPALRQRLSCGAGG